MSKILVIIESPGKKEKIEHILGKGYMVMASYGHIMDLDPNGMSIDIKNNFTPNYIVNADKKQVVTNLKNAAKNSSDVLIMSDGDREGENIGWSVAQVLKLKNPKRITFHSVTPTELKEAIKNPRQLDNNLINAQKTRRILDRIVGYELSPLLMKHIGKGSLSAGRVQSVVARLIMDKENEIKKFMSKDMKSFFKFKGEFLSDKKAFIANLYDLEGKNTDGPFKGNQSKIDEEERAREFLENCQESEFKVAHVFKKDRTQGPSAPFTTSTLQQEANRKLGMNGKRAMSAAQKLYEEGYITYMRTDSVNLSDEAMENIKKYVTEKYGDDYYRKVEYKAKSKNTQEAHEACRPTDVFTEEVEQGGKIGNDEARLYSLIWKRTVASQMKPAVYDVTSIQITISKEKKHFFMTNIENLTFAGFLSVYNITGDEEDDEEDENAEDDETTKKNKNIKIPKVGVVIPVNYVSGKQEYLRPVCRYNQASLIANLDKLGIGRPATYVNIIEKIVERNYVKIDDVEGKSFDSLTLTWKKDDDNITEKTDQLVIGKEKGKYIPTHLGVLVINFLMLYFPKVMDYNFTAEMEEKLDSIANGELVWNEVLQEFYDEFHPSVDNLLMQKAVIDDKYTKLLGKHPETDYNIFATIAKFGPVFKMIPETGKPIYGPIKEPLTFETATLEDALKLFEYPKTIGKYKNKNIVLNRGKFGFYLTYGGVNYTTTEENYTIIDAIDFIEKEQKKRDEKNKSLASFTEETKSYDVYKGPFGYYVHLQNSTTKKTYNIGLPPDEDIENITLDRIKEILNAKYNKTGSNINKPTIPKKKTTVAKTTVTKTTTPKKKTTVTNQTTPIKKPLNKKVINNAKKKNIKIE